MCKSFKSIQLEKEGVKLLVTTRKSECWKRSPEGFGCPPKSPTAFSGPGAAVRHCLEIKNVE